MGSIWSSLAAKSGASPFIGSGSAPLPGGGATTKFQSVLQASARSGDIRIPSLQGRLGSNISGSKSDLVSGGVEPLDSSSSTSSSSSSSATISANDFLTLLVTEMQNQDPTAQTDPNEYINQLVQINSLEQLISINQNLSDVLGAASSPTTPAGNESPAGEGGASSIDGNSVARSGHVGTSALSPPMKVVADATLQSERNAHRSSPLAVQGNVSEPQPTAAAHAVARSLDGGSRGVGHGHAIRDIPTR